MTRLEFIQQIVIATLPLYLKCTKEVSMPGGGMCTMPVTVNEAHAACVADARKLADLMRDGPMNIQIDHPSLEEP